MSPSHTAINDVIVNTNLNAHEKQIKIEEILKEHWKIDIYNMISNKRSLSNDNVGLQILVSQLKLLDDDFINLFRKPSSKKAYMATIKDLDPSLILSIILGKVIPFAIKYKDLDEQPITKLIINIGETIVNEAAFKLYEQDLKNNLISPEVKFKEYRTLKNLNLSEGELSKIGLDLVYFFTSRSNFVELIEVRVGRENYRRYILPKEDLLLLLENISFTDSEELPMLVKPLPWKINEGKVIEYGGTYFNNKYQLKSLIAKTHKNSIAKDMLLNTDLINTVNKLSSTGYIINRKVFDIITGKEYNKENQRLINFRPHEESNAVSQLIAEKNYSRVYDIVSYNSKYFYDNSILNIARLMLNVDEFFLTTYIDWRGRFYTSSSVLNMQGGELARGLILFSKGEALNENGLRALKIYTANAFGLDKKSKKDRIAWVDKHFENILNTPNNNLWLSADEPILFLACALELQEYNKNPSFLSRLPILLDATCNGLQHLSAIANDLNLAERVNITPSTDEDAPNDIYSDLIEPIKDSIKEAVEKEPEHYNLLKLNITRKLIKRGIMTITYGVTIKGILDQLLSEHFFKFGLENKHYIYRPKDKNMGDINLYYKNLYKLSYIIYNKLFKIHPILNNIMEYFQKMVELMNALDLAIQWITPYGLVVTQRYNKFTKYDITSVMQGKRRKIKLSRYELGLDGKCTLNKTKQVNSFIPNFIHSMDASNIILLIKKVNDLNFDIVTIHDCFGVHANNAEILSYMVKQCFISIYLNKDTIEKFHKLNVLNVRALYNVDEAENTVIDKNGCVLDIPLKPTLGDMDLKAQLADANYFIN